MLPTKEEWYRALEHRHGADLQKDISQTAVAVCGLGGLGSNIAVSLVRAGVGKLILIDFDRVDISNLHRQQYKASQIGLFKTEAMKSNLGEISPYSDTVVRTEKITEKNAGELLRDVDIICEAFDNAEAKSMLVNYVLEHFPDKYLVAASGMAGLGSANNIRTRKISKFFYLCGDGVSDISCVKPLVSSRVALCAAHQAQTVLRIIAKQFDV